jgi:hypothetical protein
MDVACIAGHVCPRRGQLARWDLVTTGGVLGGPESACEKPAIEFPPSSRGSFRRVVATNYR